MLRALSMVALSLVLYTIALMFGSLAICRASDATEVLGEWATQGHLAHVRIEPCATAPGNLCGTVTWLWEPIDARGEQVRDAKNPDPKLRERPVIGLALLREFHADAGGEWSRGRIYNPQNGRTYDASLKLRSRDVLEVKGCILFLCDTQVWRRTETVCRSGAQDVAGDERSASVR